MVTALSAARAGGTASARSTRAASRRRTRVILAAGLLVIPITSCELSRTAADLGKPGPPTLDSAVITRLDVPLHLVPLVQRGHEMLWFSAQSRKDHRTWQSPPSAWASVSGGTSAPPWSIRTTPSPASAATPASP